MKKYLFKDVPGKSNNLGVSGQTYKMIPNKIYDYHDTMQKIIDAHSDRFEEVNEEEIEIAEIEAVEKVIVAEEKVVAPLVKTEEDKVLEQKANDKKAMAQKIHDAQAGLTPEAVKVDPKKVAIEEIENKTNILKDLHWKKLKKLAEQVGLDWTDKAETLKAIIDDKDYDFEHINNLVKEL